MPFPVHLGPASVLMDLQPFLMMCEPHRGSLCLPHPHSLAASQARSRGWERLLSNRGGGGPAPLGMPRPREC